MPTIFLTIETTALECLESKRKPWPGSEDLTPTPFKVVKVNFMYFLKWNTLAYNNSLGDTETYEKRFCPLNGFQGQFYDPKGPVLEFLLHIPLLFNLQV